MPHQLQPDGLGPVSLGHAQAGTFFFEDLIENRRAQQRSASPFRECAMQNTSLEQHVQPVSRYRRTPAQP